METYEEINHIQEIDTNRVRILMTHNINHTQHIKSIINIICKRMKDAP